MTFAEFEASDSGQLEWIRGSDTAPSVNEPEEAVVRESGSAEGGAPRGSTSMKSGPKTPGDGVAEMGAYFSHHLGKGDGAREGSTGGKSPSSEGKAWLGKAWEYVAGDVTKVEASKVLIAGTVRPVLLMQLVPTH